MDDAKSTPKAYMGRELWQCRVSPGQEQENTRDRMSDRIHQNGVI